ncbi:MAG: AAA family ATPase [Candidatus Omnitrophota bacterium]
MTEEKRLKRLPYGNADFTSFLAKRLYFVDKTSYIRTIEEKGDFLFFIRPRRFGKTLFLSILEDYYDINKKTQFDTLFNGTAIHNNPTEEKNKYLIFKLNFSLVNPGTSSVEKAFLNYIKDSVSDFLTKYATLLDIDIDKAEADVNSRETASDVMIAFFKYCKRKKQKLYVIIDEYDNFANTILAASGEEKYHLITHGEGFLRAFFNVIKGGTTEGSAPIARFFMTGVSPITLDDVTSGFNIAENISLDHDVQEMLGFTHDEVETILNYYKQAGLIPHSVPELMEIMHNWYNGYRFSKRVQNQLFNPTQILYFIKEYMKNAEPPQEMIDRNLRVDYHKLRHLIVIDQKGTPKTNGNFSKLKEIIETGSIQSTLVSGFPIRMVAAPENFVSLLYYFGLLTISDTTPGDAVILKIPNETIRHLYYDYIKDTYRETGSFALDPDKYSQLMENMAFDGQWQELITFIADQMKSSMGLRDLITGEKTVQAFLNVYLGLSNLFIIHPEKELNKGFADLVLEPFIGKYPAIKYSYMIEIKYMKAIPEGRKIPEKQLRELREKAQNQLAQYSLDEKYRKTIEKTTLVKLILIFSGHQLVEMIDVQ